MNKDLLINLHQYPEFAILVKELKSMRPILPTHDPKQDNIEMWKFRSAQQQHHDMLMSIISPLKEANDL